MSSENVAGPTTDHSLQLESPASRPSQAFIYPQTTNLCSPPIQATNSHHMLPTLPLQPQACDSEPLSQADQITLHSLLKSPAQQPQSYISPQATSVPTNNQHTPQSYAIVQDKSVCPGGIESSCAPAELQQSYTLLGTEMKQFAPDCSLGNAQVTPESTNMWTKSCSPFNYYTNQSFPQASGPANTSLFQGCNISDSSLLSPTTYTGHPFSYQISNTASGDGTVQYCSQERRQSDADQFINSSCEYRY